MNPTVAFNMRLEPATKAALEEAASADRRSMSSYVDKLLTDHLIKSGRLKKPVPLGPGGYPGA